MVKFTCNKLGRDKGLEGFKAEGITPQYKIVKGQELRQALLRKLLEESNEVCDANGREAVTAELADLLEVIDGLCKAYDISLQDIARVKERKRQERGGFETGLYIETIEMDENNPKVKHFRASPDKYQEI